MNSSLLTFETWKSSGQFVFFHAQKKTVSSHSCDESVGVFVRIEGEVDAPWITLLHGFPSSSMDWHKVLPDLKRHYRVILFDFIGFGASAKPTKYPYSTFERADLAEALWKHFSISNTTIIAHDIGATVTLELLARKKSGNLHIQIDRLILTNGGLLSSLHQPVLPQKLLLNWHTAWLIKLFIPMIFKKQFGNILHQKLSDQELSEIWESINHNNGPTIYDKLIRYIIERKENINRWEPLVSEPGVPARFIWGLADKIAGKPMIDAIRANSPNADISELPETGHYPHLEQPTLFIQAALRQDLKSI